MKTKVSQLNLVCPDEASMVAWANKIADKIIPGMILFFEGELGAGKSTLIRAILRHLGITQKIKSPSYALVETYELKNNIIYHFDFYRIHHADELYDIGIDEYFLPTTISLIEWPKKGFPHLPTPDLICHIQMMKEGRQLCLEAISKSGQNILSYLST